MAEVFASLHHLTDERALARGRERLVRATSGARETLALNPLLLAARICWSAAAASSSKGRSTTPAPGRSRSAALAAPDPTICVLRLDPDRWPQGAPGGRPSLGAVPAAMVCRGQSCSLPVTTADALRRLFAER